MLHDGVPRFVAVGLLPIRMLNRQWRLLSGRGAGCIPPDALQAALCSFNLFKRRLQSNRHRSSGMQGLTLEDTSRDGGFSPSGKHTVL